MNYSEASSLLKEHGQEQLLDYFGELNEAEQKELLGDIEKIDFSIIENADASHKAPGKITPVTAVDLSEIALNRRMYAEAGTEILRQGKVGAVLLAGGQGTRLGSDKPKGMFNIGVKRKLSIFEQQMNNISAVVAETGAYFHIFVMTSELTDADTRKFFSDNKFFGYPGELIHFFVQDVSPACDKDGKIYLENKHKVLLLPNGNGGWYSSLIKSGLGDIIKEEQIEWLNVYGVDNVLQRICDPAFIGATALGGYGCGSKVVKKVSAEEKVGVLCNEDGKPTVIEYYEMPVELKNKRTESGELEYCYGVILNYLFNVEKLNAALSCKLPYHKAFKAVPHLENGVTITPSSPCGYKFETLAVDIVKNMGSCLAFEVERNKEFAPVKNAEGTDSVATARALLKENGIRL